jgi:hypothetical protein
MACIYYINGEAFSKEQFLDYVKTQSQDEIASVTPLMKNKVGEFSSSHFYEKNILVHIRYNTRTDADGKKVLFLEEVQSDWGQKGKKEGFVEKLESITKDNSTIKKINDKESDFAYKLNYNGKDLAFVFNDEKHLFKNQSEIDNILIHRANRGYVRRQEGKTPKAPFITDTNKWVSLGLKVALKEAVKQGADKIAWTTGEQQNDRYDLQKQVDFIDVFTNDDGTYHIIAVKGNNTISEEKSLKENQLEGLLGKDLTKKIIEDTKNHTHKEGEENLVKTYRGNDLSVGGKGMKGFYGSPTEGTLGIVGNVAKSLFKQEPKTVDIKLSDNLNAPFDITVKDEKGNITTHNFDSKSKASAWLSKEVSNGAKYEVISEKSQQEITSTQHSIDITPELKTQVEEQGLPLFQKQFQKTNISKLTDKQIEDETENIINGKSIFKRFSQAQHGGFIKGGRHHIQATLLTQRLRESSKEDSTEWEAQAEKVLEDYAKEQGIWKDLKSYGEPQAIGAESYVWFDEKSKKVTKAIGTDIQNGLDNLLDRITIHNTLFPATKMEVVGFAKDKLGDFYVIVEQPFIKAEQSNSAEVRNYFKELGFKESDAYDLAEIEYTNEDTVLTDMHLGNVLKSTEGTIEVIDGLFYLNHSETGYGSTRVLDNSIESTQTSIQNQSVATQVKPTTNGFIIGSDIYINTESSDPTQVSLHEYSHAYLNKLKIARPDLYKKGLELAKSEDAKPYIEFVKANQPNLEEGTEKFENEVLAQAIGDNGAKLVKAESKNVIAQIWDWIKSKLGLTQMSNEQVKNLTIEEYAKAIGIDLMRGEKLFTEAEKAQEYFTRNADRLPLTLAVFQRPEFVAMQGKMVNPITVLNSLNQSGIKQIEKDLIKGVIEQNYQGQKKISYDELEATVRANIMPLERIFTSSYADYGMSNLGDGRYGEANTIILNAPIEHGVTGHFSGDFKASGRKNIKYVSKQLNDNTWVAVEEGYEANANDNNIYQYVGTAGTKENVDDWIENYEKPTSNTYSINDDNLTFEIERLDYGKEVDEDLWTTQITLLENGKVIKKQTGFPYNISEEDAKRQIVDLANGDIRRANKDINKGMFGHIRVWQDGQDFYVAELQSDYFQKQYVVEDMTQQVVNSDKHSFTAEQKAEYNAIFRDMLKYRQTYFEQRDYIKERYRKSFGEATKEELEALETYKKNYEEKKAQYEKIVVSKARPLFEKDQKQFIASQKEWEKRMVREAIKEASLSGATSLRFPTPYTLSVIEGYLSEGAPYEIENANDSTYLEAGDRIYYAGEDYTLIDSDNTTITIAESGRVQSAEEQDIIDNEIENAVDNDMYEIENNLKDFYTEEEWNDFRDNYSFISSIELNDVSNKIEEGVFEVLDWKIRDKVTEYYQEVFTDANSILSDSGVSDIYQSGTTFYYTDGTVNIETLMQPSEYKGQGTKDSFSIEDDLDGTQQTVARKYEEIAEILKKERGEDNFEVVTDKNGFDWYETKIESSEVNNPVIAFQNTTGITKAEAIKRNNGNPLNLTPNGKPSILYQSYIDLGYSVEDAESLTAQVYSNSFFNFFGDWINDAENSSKVVDKNGQPLAVYHGTRNKFNEFKFREDSTHFHGKGNYFTPFKSVANNYGSMGGEVKTVFLSIKNPLQKDLSLDLYKQKKPVNYEATQIVIENTNQIKSATENIGTFDSGSNDIRFQIQTEPQIKFAEISSDTQVEALIQSGDITRICKL